ncbi:MAG: hypothetical protein IPJ13_32550 [Saprospiraceae bacterium]|nr:hypothetical protein [Saprospiraceae bacterium]
MFIKILGEWIVIFSIASAARMTTNLLRIQTFKGTIKVLLVSVWLKQLYCSFNGLKSPPEK